MNSAIKETNFNLPGQKKFYRGKVRDVYFFEDKIALVATDRISAFDVVLPEPIPFKGQVLNQIAAKFLQATQDIVPNWLQETPDPNVSIGLHCKPFPIEMVVRGYLAGHAWRTYRSGERMLCGVSLPENLKENDQLPSPIITPTTKAHEGHDEDISREAILTQGIIDEATYSQLEQYSLALFERGTAMARSQGLILVDTKYEFGTDKGIIYLIDEVHTPDSSRYFYSEGYDVRQQNNQPQQQLSKEFVRQWLIENGFQGKEGQQIPDMTESVVKSISDRYIELYEKVTGQSFEAGSSENVQARIEKNMKTALA